MKEYLIKRIYGGVVFALAVFGTTILAVAISGTITTWTTGQVLKSSDLNTTIASLKTAIEGIPNWTKAANGNDAYYTAGNVRISGTGLNPGPSTSAMLEINGGALGLVGGSTTYLQFYSSYASANYRIWRMENGGGTSTLSFTRYNDDGITPSLGTSQFSIAGDTGYVGIGKSNPAYPLQVGTSASNGNGAYVTTGGVWTNGSSKSSKKNIVDLSSKEAIDALVKLEPKIYNYKNDENETYVGFLAEDVPELVATKDRKHLSPMDIVAVTVKVVQEQEKKIDSLKAENKKLRETVETHGRASLRLEDRLRAIENMQMARK